MRVWITRTRPGAERTADRARALGLEPLVEPLFEVRPLGSAVDLGGVAALAFTSGHGVAAFAALCSIRALPAFAVGDATAAAAREAGFADVRSANGDVAALARLIAGTGPEGTVLHAAAAEPAGDLEGALRSAGLRARTAPVYQTVERAWTAPLCDAVVVQSPRAAGALADRLPAAPLAFACVSEPAAAPLRAAGCGDVRVAAIPTEADTLALLAPGLGNPRRSV